MRLWRDVSRRSFLFHAAAAASAVALTGSAVAAGKVRLRNPNSPAAASGSIWLGGDIQVNRIGLGTSEFTSVSGVLGADPATIRALLRRAIDLGVNHLDTAVNYGAGLGVDSLCERFIYEALYPYPSDLLIATKGGQVRAVPGSAGHLDGRPEHLRSACEGSLKRLKLEQIGLYYMHQPDPKVPYEDSIGELEKLQKEGKIRHIGISNINAEQFAKARSLVKVVAVQNQYNVLSRQSDEILATCERERIAFIAFGPMGGRTAAALNATDTRLAGLQALAEKRHISQAQAVLGWLLARSPMMMAIPGTTKIEHLEDNVGSARVRLTKKEMEQIG